MTLNDLLENILTLAQRLGTTPYLVGGPVRDALTGYPCHDWDLVCRDAARLARAAARRWRAPFIVLDDKNKIYRVVVGRAEELISFDFAELQGKNIEEDLGRRDFTINAMAMPLAAPLTLALSPRRGDFVKNPSPWGEGRVRGLIDPFGGRRDVQKKIIRAVSERSFRDDPIRLLRAYRFTVQLGFSIEPQTGRWIRAYVKNLRHGSLGVAAERIREEWMKLLSRPGAAPCLKKMDQDGLLRIVIPEMEPCRRTAVRYYGRGGVLKHSLQTVENLEWIIKKLQGCFKDVHLSTGLQTYLHSTIGGFPRGAWLKLAGFLHDIGKPETALVRGGRLRFFGHEDVGAGLSRRAMERLRFSRLESQTVSSLVRHHMRLGSLAAAAACTDKALARYLRDLDPEAVGMVLVSLADHYGYLARSQWGKGRDPVEKMASRLLEAYYVRREKILPPRLITGHDLMRRLKLKPGPVIGKLLEAVQDAQAEGKVLTKAEALGLAKKRLKKETQNSKE